MTTERQMISQMQSKVLNKAINNVLMIYILVATE